MTTFLIAVHCSSIALIGAFLRDPHLYSARRGLLYVADLARSRQLVIYVAVMASSPRTPL